MAYPASTIAKYFYAFLVFTSQLFSTNQELFTATTDLAKLLQTEKTIAELLQKYLVAENERLDKLKLFRDNYMKIHSAASDDSESYLANPVNAYLLVKRLTTDWKQVENMVITGPTETGRDILSSLNQSNSVNSFPSAEDLNGAADALLRLQDTYQIDTSSIARGRIPVREPSKNMTTNQLELTAADCFELGRHSYANGDYYHTKLWMTEALDLLEEEEIKTAELHDILEYLAFATFQSGDIETALQLTNRLLSIDPHHERALGNKIYYENMIESAKSNKKLGDDEKEVVVDNFVQSKSTAWPTEKPERELYEALCRGEKQLSPRVESELKCFFWDTSKSPYLRYTHIKVEEAFKKPHILQFYDVITDTEINVIKNLAGPRLQRATVQNYKTGELEYAAYRISKSAWLKNSEDEAIARMSRRIEDILGLNQETAEELQVVNYGIGGHYEAHYDFARKEERNAFKNLGTGNRIATWLNYMSDVEAGGATVFPAIGVSVWPKKNSAAFWYNLHRNGEGDMLTRHAACPVLIGSKWVSNKWFHEKGQEFRRPCGLKINEYNLGPRLV